MIENNTDKTQDSERFVRGDILKMALDKFDGILGITMKDLMVKYFESKGIVFDNEHKYGLEEIENQFVELFGKDGTSLLSKRLKRKSNYSV